MANLRDVRGRIRGVSQTLQVTKAMKLISTSKLRRARRMLSDSEPYFSRIRETMGEIVGSGGRVESEFFAQRGHAPDRRTAVVMITSDRGLAGGYNANVLRFAEGLCQTLPNPFLIVVGAVGQRLLAGSSLPVLESFTFHSRIPEVRDAKEIADFVVSQFQWEAFDEVIIVYTHMHGPIKLVPESIRVLPLEPEAFSQEGGRSRIVFDYLPSATAVFDVLAPLYVKGVVYGALVEAYASEQSARMAAMDEASKNAEEMLGALQLAYNRARQASITQEVTEIVSGASALGD